jgi:hypothetical protein
MIKYLSQLKSTNNNMMCKPWKKLSKDEKNACVMKKFRLGVAAILFGLFWMYFDSAPMALIVLGLLVILYSLIMKISS